MTTRIAMWSGPRNISTAMLRSWENRPDTSVVDEPFYACYLKRSRSQHPGFDEIMASQSACYEDVALAMSKQLCATTIQFQKHMTHHLYHDNDLGWTKNLKHFFLIRDPVEIVRSYTAVRGTCTLEDIGVEQQLWLYQKISDITGQDIPVIDSNDVLNDPARLIQMLCDKLEVRFTDKMLKWPAGKRDTDGVWARYWYASVESSTGFKVREKSGVEPRVEYASQESEVVRRAMPSFLKLHRLRLNPEEG